MAKKFSEIIQGVRESALKGADFPIDEACWDTHKQVGMKKKGDRMVPNCVPKNEQFASDKPEPSREPVDNRFTSRPSKSVHKPAPLASPRNMSEDLRKWFDPNHPEGGWKRINSKGEAIGPCAREPGEAKPKCMSNAKRASLTKKERASAVASKRKHDPNPERKGTPINVSNYGKGKLGESMEQIDEKNEPTNPSLWARAKSLAKQKFDVYPSAYANGWASKWYKSKGGGWKSVNEAKEEQEYDYEGDMAMSDLRSILHNAKEIHDMLEPKTNMPEWCQSKITLAEDYLSTVANYLRGEMNEEVESLEEKGPGLWANIRAKKARGEKMRKPGEAGAPTEAQLKSARNEEVENLDEMPGANMDTLAVHKHLRKTGWSLTRTKGGHDVYTHPKSEKHIAVPRHRQLKAPLVRGIMKDAQVSEDIEQMTEAKAISYEDAIDKHAKDIAHDYLNGGNEHLYQPPSHLRTIYGVKQSRVNSDVNKAFKKHVALLNKVSEEVEQIEEISQQTKQSYVQKAKGQVKELEPHAKSGEYRDIAKNMINRREKGIAMATESRGHKIIATKLAQIEARRKQEQEIAKRTEQERKQNEPVKPVKEEKGSWQKETDWKKSKPEPVDKSGAKHSAMSRAKHLAKMASKKKVLEQDNNNQVDNVRTPAKQSLAFRGVVKNMEKPTKSKKTNDDKFEAEPELNTQIMRNN